MITKRLLILGIILFCASVVLGVVSLPTMNKSTGSSLVKAPKSRDLQILEHTLDQIKRAWNPRVKARVIANARSKTASLETPLLWILSRPTHDRLAEAIPLAAELDLQGARPLMARLATTAPEDLRSAAIVAAGRLQPWSRAELIGFFGSADPTVREAAAKSAAVAPDELLLELFLMLTDPEAIVRDAALEAVPTQIPDQAREDLLELAKHAEGVAEVCVVHALGRIEFREDTEAMLVEKLDSEDRSVRAAALDSLTRKGDPLRRPSAVWSLAFESIGDPTERARALLCLERTRSFSVPELRREIWFIRHPLPQFFAARCLVSAGERLGAEILVELLKTESEGLGDLDVDSLLYAVRTLLGELSGTDASAGPMVWADWLDRVKELSPRTLEPPDVVLQS